MTLEQLLALDQKTLINQYFSFDNPLTFGLLIEKGYQKPGTIDIVTWESIVQYFKKRRIQEDFDRFFKQAIRINFPYYRERLRVDPTVTQIDWFTEIYKEHSTETQRKDIDTLLETLTSEATSSTTGHSQSDGTSSGTSQSSGSDSFTEGSQAENDQRNISVGRQAPASASWPWEDTQEFANRNISAGSVNKVSNAGAGISNPHITNPTATQDTYNMGNAVSQNTHAGSDSRNGSTSNSSQNIMNSTGQTEQTGSGQTERTANHEFDNVSSEITTGRHNKLSEMIIEARECIEATTSFEFFVQKLDPCFMQAY